MRRCARRRVGPGLKHLRPTVGNGRLGASAKGELEQDEIRDKRLPDMVLFGVKLHTAMGVRLPDLDRKVQLPAE